MAEALNIGGAMRHAGEAMSQTTEAMSHTADKVRDRWDATDQRVRAFVQEYPLTSFFAALAAGYLVARLASRLS